MIEAFPPEEGSKDQGQQMGINHILFKQSKYFLQFWLFIVQLKKNDIQESFPAYFKYVSIFSANCRKVFLF